jgi:hypothetical protein
MHHGVPDKIADAQARLPHVQTADIHLLSHWRPAA